MKLPKLSQIGVAAIAAALALPATAADYTLRMQTHFSAESPPGQVIQQFIDDLDVMSGGRVGVQMHYSSELVAQNELFGATGSGIVDCYLSGSGPVGKNAALQFTGDIMGGYDTPYQFIAWLYHGGGLELVQDLYAQYDLHFVGYWLQGHESLSSTTPIATFDDLKDWKFRSPPGLETEIFAAFGAKPVVMDFGEVPTALRTGVVDGADASTLATNKSLGLFDTAKYVTYPGFHSMPAEQLSCNKKVWDGLPADVKRMMEVAVYRAALDIAMITEIRDKQVAVEIANDGITIHDWSVEDRKKFREFARTRWEDWKSRSPDAPALVDSHVAFMKQLGLID